MHQWTGIMKKLIFECNECFDTGCCCGGIGLSCHGCCSCKKGKEAQENRRIAIDEILAIIALTQSL